MKTKEVELPTKGEITQGWTLELALNVHGNLYIEFPPQLTNSLGWEEDDKIGVEETSYEIEDDKEWQDGIGLLIRNLNKEGDQ